MTGATGAIGEPVVRHLREAGYAIRFLGRRPWSGPKVATDEYVQRDLRFPEALEAEDFADCVGTVWMAVDRSGSASMDVVNVEAVRRATELSQYDAPGYRLVLFSTVSVYGSPRVRVVDEQTPTLDVDDMGERDYWVGDSLRQYGRSKLRGELALRSALTTGRAVIARPTVIVNGHEPRSAPSVPTRIFWARRATHHISADRVGSLVVGALQLTLTLENGSATIINFVDPAGEDLTYGDLWGVGSAFGLPLKVLQAIDWARYARRLPLRHPFGALRFTNATDALHADATP